MGKMLIFGMGYSAGVVARRLIARGWDVVGTSRSGADGTMRFDDKTAVVAALRGATHILSSVPPDAAGDAVLLHYGEAIALAPARWVGYLSSTGVYGDAGGAWVDESAPVAGRRGARNAADAAWQALRGDTRVFRLPGIYGPGRSALERVAEGKAHRIAIAGQVFSRVHVDDIAGGVIASFAGPPGVYNLGDDLPCSQNRVIEAACRLLGVAPPPLQSLEAANLSPMALGFYAENRRVANGKARRILGWKLRYPDYESGLAAIFAGGR